MSAEEYIICLQISKMCYAARAKVANFIPPQY